MRPPPDARARLAGCLLWLASAAVWVYVLGWTGRELWAVFVEGRR